MVEEHKPSETGGGFSQKSREVQRETLERILAKTKIRLSSDEKMLMDELVTELDILQLKGKELEDKFERTPGLRELVLLAQQEDQDGLDHEDLPPSSDLPLPDSDLAKITRPPELPTSDGLRPASAKPRVARPPVAPQPPPPPVSRRPAGATSRPIPKVMPPSTQKPGRPDPEMTVRKYIEAWNQKAFGAEFACFAKRARTMDKDSYVERRMDTYLSETKDHPVIRKMGTLLSKRTYGESAEILCERIVRQGTKELAYLENYVLCFEDNDWRIVQVCSVPEKSPIGRQGISS